MGLSALAERAGLPIGTVKYYLREGLLPEGVLRTRNRADYSEEHLRRLRLLRLLREVGDVPVDRLLGLVDALEADAGDDHMAVLGRGSLALAPRRPAAPADAETAHSPETRRTAEGLVRHAGWDRLDPHSPTYEALLDVLDVLEEWEDMGPGVNTDNLRRYAEAADQIGRVDIDSLDAEDPAGMLAQLVVGQVAYGRLFDVLRRLAEEHHASVRFAHRGAADG